MRARSIRHAARFGAAALTTAAVVAAGGSLVARAGPGGYPCDEGALPVDPGAQPIQPCVEPDPPPTGTEPVPTEPPAETDPPPTGGEETTSTPTPDEPEPEPDEPPKRPSKPPEPPPPTAPPPDTGATGAGGLPGAPLDNGTPTLSGGPYVFPVIGTVAFSDTWGAPRATVAWHHGVDIFAPAGTPVVAVADGTLFSVGWNRVGGRRLWLRDRQGNWFYYAHLSGFSPLAVEGARVWAGAVVGYVGTTGDAVGTPPHLHFEVHPVSLLSLGYDGAVNPFPYVSAWPRLQRGLEQPAAGATGASGAAGAPTPGAILLGFTDISTTSGLASAPLAESIDGGGAAAVVVHDPGRAAGPAVPARKLPAGSAEGARIARSLDEEATRRLQHGAGIWDRLALCESGGDWSANTGNGYLGGLQFHPQTWLSHGGAAFAPSADLATRAEQILVAQRVLRTQGWRAWPVCSALLGLNPFAHE